MFQNISWHIGTYDFLSYKCVDTNKAFYDSSLNKFYSTQVATCQSDKTWNKAAITLPCEWNGCTNPPTPPAQSGMAVFNFNNPKIGEFAVYKCNVGGENKVQGDYATDTFKIVCEPGNQITSPATWPTCLAGK